MEYSAQNYAMYAKPLPVTILVICLQVCQSNALLQQQQQRGAADSSLAPVSFLRLDALSSDRPLPAGMEDAHINPMSGHAWDSLFWNAPQTATPQSTAWGLSLVVITTFVVIKAVAPSRETHRTEKQVTFGLTCRERPLRIRVCYWDMASAVHVEDEACTEVFTDWLQPPAELRATHEADVCVLCLHQGTDVSMISVTAHVERVLGGAYSLVQTTDASKAVSWVHAKRTIINVYAKKDVMVLPDKVATSAGPKEVTLGFVDISNDSVPYAMKDSGLDLGIALGSFIGEVAHLKSLELTVDDASSLFSILREQGVNASCLVCRFCQPPAGKELQDDHTRPAFSLIDVQSLST